jgi:hypothetical protein
MLFASIALLAAVCSCHHLPCRGYHTIFTPTKTQYKSDSPHHPSDADDGGADDNDADNDGADNDDADNNADNNADNAADNAAAMQTTTRTQLQITPPRCR